MNGSEELEELRREVKNATGGIIRMIAYRNSLASRIARIKASASLPMVDERVEEDLEKYVLQTCRKEGVGESAGLEIFTCLLKESKRVQAPLLAQGARRSGEGGRPAFKEVAVIGCSGGMGSYLVRYFTSQGSSVRGADPRRPSFSYPGFRYVSSDVEAVASTDLAVIASPLESTAEVIHKVLDSLPDGCVLVELSSVKEPLGASLSKIRKEGRVNVISLHPLFGPSQGHLKGATIILVPVDDAGSELQLAKKVFPEAEFVVLSRNDHDMAMALSLSLTHVTSLAFCRTLSRYTTPEEFRRVAAPFATLQLSLGEGILLQDPHLYSQIQVSNRFSGRIIGSLAKEVEGLRQVIAAGDQGRFARLFLELGRLYGPDTEGRDILGAIYRASEQTKESSGVDDP